MVNSHFVPKQTLRKFADKICLYNIKTGEYRENVKIDKAFSQVGFYDDETENIGFFGEQENWNNYIEYRYSPNVENQLQARTDENGEFFDIQDKRCLIDYRAPYFVEEVLGEKHIFDVPQKDYPAKIESIGAKAVSGVTSKTDYLITNTPDSGSSKNNNAKKYGTKIITEEEFLKMIGEV